MRVLRRLPPTPEQIRIIQRIQQGISLIRGAAGSGKTSTALMALRATTGATVNQLRNEGRLPANVLVLTYNNSLKGYISAVAENELADYADEVRLFILTFDKWAFRSLAWRGALPVGRANTELRRLARGFPRDVNFVADEVNYLLGRFERNRLNDYLVRPRIGRGGSPQMDRAMRQRLLNEVVQPYLAYKERVGIRDFHDLAAAMASADPETLYDVVIVDEAQDFSANQLRAVVRHAAPDATITIVTDTAQRIYPRGAPWAEAGINIPPNRSFRLSRNYRNTRQIASLSASIAAGLPIDDDGSLPDPEACIRDGERPILLIGLFSRQLAFAFDRLEQINLAEETVGFLHLKGGGWFDAVRVGLAQRDYAFCELQGVEEWPEEGPNIGLCTLHSAKGLEFDHVFLLGLAQEHASHGDEEDDDRYTSLRRLLAMAVGRARQTVVLGAKPGAALGVLARIDPQTLDEVRV